MPGRKPILASLISGLMLFTRDFFYRVLLEPASHESRKSKENKTKKK